MVNTKTTWNNKLLIERKTLPLKHWLNFWNLVHRNLKPRKLYCRRNLQPQTFLNLKTLRRISQLVQYNIFQCDRPLTEIFFHVFAHARIFFTLENGLYNYYFQMRSANAQLLTVHYRLALTIIFRVIGMNSCIVRDIWLHIKESIFKWFCMFHLVPYCYWP